MGNIVKRAREGALILFFELGLDILGSILLKYVRKLNYLVCGDFVENIILFYSLNQYLLSLDVVGSFDFMLTKWICCTLFCILCALNGFKRCRYYT